MTLPFDIIDLTHSLSEESPCWDLDCGFSHKDILTYEDCSTAVKFKVQTIAMPAGIGTHMDAPAHCLPGGATVDGLDLTANHLVTNCLVINTADKCREDYLVNEDDILQFERRHGRIPAQSFVIFHTGWGMYWNDAEKYRNNLVFPSINKAVAEILLSRKIAGIGIDTLSPDRLDSDFPVHQLLLSNGKYIIENVAYSDKLPTTGAYTLALPMKLTGATEAPVRLIGLVLK